MRTSWGGLAFLAALAGCGSQASTPDAAPDGTSACACEGSGITVVVEYEQGFCQVYDYSLQVIFPGGSANRGDLRCTDGFIGASGFRVELPWPEGVSAGEQGTVSIDLVGDMDEALGTASLTAAPDTCATVTIQATCHSDFPDAAPADAASADAAP